MSVLNIPAGVLPRPRNKGVVRNLQKPITRLNLGSREVWRVDGDNRWRLIICHQGEIWITQAWDLRDYVLKEGDMFLVTLPGTVVVQALKEAEVEISASLKTKPYRGEYVFYP
ncbi:MAG: DUF2917 domain-containing protein [Anaerolineales bacterium]|jgi:hypothetical protein